MPSIRDFEEWLTTSETATKLGKSRQGVVWMLENGRLRGSRTKLGWLVDPIDVDSFYARVTKRRQKVIEAGAEKEVREADADERSGA